MINQSDFLYLVDLMYEYFLTKTKNIQETSIEIHTFSAHKYFRVT